VFSLSSLSVSSLALFSFSLFSLETLSFLYHPLTLTLSPLVVH
jgi:hypothetical protein